MAQLLALNIYKLKKNKIFIFGIFITIICAIIPLIYRFHSTGTKNSDFKYLSAQNTTLIPLFIILMISTLLISILIGRDYSYGTIRNLFLAGHTRFEIYFANLITYCLSTVMLFLLFNFTTSLTHSLFYNGSIVISSEEIISICVQCISLICFSSIQVLFAMTIQNKYISRITLISLTLFMLFFAPSSANALNEPQHFTNHAIVYESNEKNFEQYGTFKEENPKYISGIKRVIFEQLDNALPLNQIYKFYNPNRTPKTIKLASIIPYSLLFTFSINILGIHIFAKKDIK